MADRLAARRSRTQTGRAFTAAGRTYRPGASCAALSGRKSRDKGARVEREIVNWHRDLGVYAERVPLSGATGYLGPSSDIDVYLFGRDHSPLRIEVKARKDGGGFRLIHNWLETPDGLITKQNGTEEVVHLPLRTYVKLLAYIADLQSRLLR